MTAPEREPAGVRTRTPAGFVSVGRRQPLQPLPLGSLQGKVFLRLEGAHLQNLRQNGLHRSWVRVLEVG